MSLALTLMPLADVRALAEVAAKSGMFSVKTADSAMALMMLCQATGMHPWLALRRYHIVDGKPSMRAEAMLADFQEGGGKVEWLQRTDTAVEAAFHAPGLVKPEKVKWTIEQAKAAGLATKDNWRKYPRQMLTARVISEGVRLSMPSVVSGLYTPEEIQDLDKTEYIPPPARTAAAPTPPTVPTAATVVPYPATSPSPDTIEAAKKVFPGAKVLDGGPKGSALGVVTPPDPGTGVSDIAPVVAVNLTGAGMDRVKRLGKLFTMPPPDGLGWKRPAIVEFLVMHYGTNQLSALTPEQVASCEAAVVGMLADGATAEPA